MRERALANLGEIMVIYFIQAGNKKGPIKIGYTKDISKRLTELQVGCPFTLNLLFFFPAKSKKHAQKMESWFHNRWFRRHIRGEWFKSITYQQIQASISLALTDKDWDEIRSEHGGNYESRGETRPLNHIEKTNQEQVDKALPSFNDQPKLKNGETLYVLRETDIRECEDV